ncbi:hypothetical protein ACWGRK_19590 [Saccharomonospora azurea]|uniref:Uncharacterized protein n=1 Tax=Saccharomonospora azurea NA-128 TaxID=882081 RepID=H8GCE9_9PSEU|nr:hypothetical protein [Saccharomonospora azurea]EHK87762.1 hypothetical protein SZMC14600_08744 [Saccharomonospora azurea SZMC 14600]EHY88783.1 hypothetical protein SacazDRAFT_01865 [Saccharomonospora azurea NA-128]
MGKKKQPSPDDPKAVVRNLMKAGKVKKKCCRSKPRCDRCPVRALKKAEKKARKKAEKDLLKAHEKDRKKARKKADKADKNALAKTREQALRTPEPTHSTA